MKDLTVKILVAATVIALIAGIEFTALNARALTAVQIQTGGTGTTTGPGYGQVPIGGKNGEYEYVATSTFGGLNTVTSVFGRTGAVAAQSGDYTTSLVPEGSNLYYTLTRWASALAGTTTDALAEGVNNLYFTNARALAQFIANLAATSSVKSITTLPNLSLPYSQLTGTPSIPTKTSDLTNDSGFVTSSFSTTSANYWSSLGLGFSTTSSDYWKTQRNFFSTTSADYWGSTKGYLTSAVTSVSGTYPVQSSGGNTPAISLAFGTTTQNFWNRITTFPRFPLRQHQARTPPRRISSLPAS